MYDWAWRAYSKRRIEQYPECVECKKEGRVRCDGHEMGGLVTDHIRPHKGDHTLFRDPTNHQTLCRVHHDRKTATEDGGFGQAPK